MKTLTTIFIFLFAFLVGFYTCKLSRTEAPMSYGKVYIRYKTFHSFKSELGVYTVTYTTNDTVLIDTVYLPNIQN